MYCSDKHSSFLQLQKVLSFWPMTGPFSLSFDSFFLFLLKKKCFYFETSVRRRDTQNNDTRLNDTQNLVPLRYAECRNDEGCDIS
jgi:hypothetical protein